jgi:hypothetical protein
VTANDPRVTRVDSLINQGREIRKPFAGIGPQAYENSKPPAASFSEWSARCVSFLHSVVGSDHLYTTTFTRSVALGTVESLDRGLGVLGALRADLVDGQLGTPQQGPVTGAGTRGQGIPQPSHDVSERGQAPSAGSPDPLERATRHWVARFAVVALAAFGAGFGLAEKLRVNPVERENARLERELERLRTAAAQDRAAPPSRQIDSGSHRASDSVPTASRRTGAK